jgi:glycosyltransferase involved in cell wall biosynthesis
VLHIIRPFVEVEVMTSMQNDKFIEAIIKSLRVIRTIFGSQQFSVSLLDSHVQFSENGANFVESPHFVPCISLPITLNELSKIEDLQIDNLLHVDTLAYVAIMATGGVEWNTISVLNLMENQSLIVSRIKPDVSTGDLNREALQNGIPIFCNYGCEEVTSLPLAYVFERIAPNVLWICNWSVQDESESQDIYDLNKKMRLIDQRSYDTKEGWIQTVNKGMAKSIFHFIATNGVIAAEIGQRIGFQGSEKVTIVRPVLRSRPKYSDSAPFKSDLYQISRLSKQKRIDRGLNMYRSILDFGYKDSWNIVGDGPLRLFLECESLKLPGVKFHGFKPTMDVINSAYGFIQSSDFEGLPMVVIEALAAGVPVFATETGDLPWLKSQLQDFNCNLLTLSKFDDDNVLYSNFLEWRRDLPGIWNSDSRHAVSEKVSKLFDPLNASSAYFDVFNDRG